MRGKNEMFYFAAQPKMSIGWLDQTNSVTVLLKSILDGGLFIP